jgi:hypothetical protein
MPPVPAEIPPEAAEYREFGGLGGENPAASVNLLRRRRD